jgi:hypothetical protein
MTVRGVDSGVMTGELLPADGLALLIRSLWRLMPESADDRPALAAWYEKLGASEPLTPEPDLTVKLARVAASLAPDVLYIRWSEGDYWQDFTSALFFRVVVADSWVKGDSSTRSQLIFRLAGRNGIARKVEKMVRTLLSDDARFAYFNYRTQSEVQRLKEPEWMPL